jgi:hypothetical protein
MGVVPRSDRPAASHLADDRVPETDRGRALLPNLIAG